MRAGVMLIHVWCNGPTAATGVTGLVAHIASLASRMTGFYDDCKLQLKHAIEAFEDKLRHRVSSFLTVQEPSTRPPASLTSIKTLVLRMLDAILGMPRRVPRGSSRLSSLAPLTPSRLPPFPPPPLGGILIDRACERKS